MLDRIFHDKKDKQRYLDYAFKIGVKHAFKQLIKNNVINPSSVKRLYFFNDEHTTATNGRYELREGLEQEFKSGTYNFNYQFFYTPLFEKLECVNLEFCCSKSKRLIRAADIVANRCYFEATRGDIKSIINDKCFITFLPK